MTPRERVRAALEFTEPDRVPIAVGGSAQKFDEPLLFELLRHFEIPTEELEPVFAAFRYTYVCESLWRKLGIDTRYLYVQAEPSFTLEVQEQGTEFVNEWGVDLDFGRGTFSDSLTLRHARLREADSVADVERYPWPDPDAEHLTTDMAVAAKRSLDAGYSVMAYRPVMVGIFSMARFLRSTDQFLVDMMLDKEFARALLGRITEVQQRYYRPVLEAVGRYIDVIEIEDDLGTQQAPMISPELYNELLKPYHEQMIRFIKRLAPEVKVMLHTDGSVAEMIPSFIEAGFDVMNPIQTSARGMDVAELKRDFGGNIVFQGAIDTQTTLRGSAKDVEEEVKRVIDIMAPGGGFLLGPGHNFIRDIPVENVITMFKTALEYGAH